MTEFASLKIVGGLLPAELLARVFAGDRKVPGTNPQTYGLERGESVRRQASRSWLYLLEVWQDFQRRIAEARDDAERAEATSARVTRERWLHILLRELGFRPAAAEGSFEIDGKVFPVSHREGQVPVHLLGFGTDLDHRTPQTHRPGTAVDGPGTAEPRPRVLVGGAVQRRHAPPAARLRHTDGLGLCRVRPGGDLRRRTLL